MTPPLKRERTNTGAGSMPLTSDNLALPTSVITFEHFTVRPDRIIASVRVTDERFAYTNPYLINALVARFPYLLEHDCINNVGPTFGHVANDTALPHLVEHLVIAIQAEREPVSARGKWYLGKTFWTDRSELRAQIEVNYADDLIALRAFSDATAAIDFIMLK